MLYKEATCQVCGDPILVAQRTVLCGKPECDVIYQRDQQRRSDWKRHHGDEPYPYPRFREPERICGVCNKPVRHPSHLAHYCAGWCHKVAESQRAARFYQRHRERVLAKEAAKRRAAKAVTA